MSAELYCHHAAPLLAVGLHVRPLFCCCMVYPFGFGLFIIICRQWKVAFLYFISHSLNWWGELKSSAPRVLIGIKTSVWNGACEINLAYKSRPQGNRVRQICVFFRTHACVRAVMYVRAPPLLPGCSLACVCTLFGVKPSQTRSGETCN